MNGILLNADIARSAGELKKSTLIEFVYVLVSTGVKKYPGAPSRRHITKQVGKKFGVVHTFDPDLNMTKQFEIFTMFLEDSTLAPVIECGGVAPWAEGDLLAMKQFYAKVAEKCILHGLSEPIIKGSVDMLNRIKELDAPWLESIKVWESDGNIEDSTAFIVGPDEGFDISVERGIINTEQERGSIPEPQACPARYYAQISNPMGTHVYFEPSLKSKVQGSYRRGQLVMVDGEENGFARISKFVSGWIPLNDLSVYNPGSKGAAHKGKK